MDFEHSAKVRGLVDRLEAFMADHVYPREEEVERWLLDPETQWTLPACFAELKERARAAGLWNLFLPHEYGEFSPGLTNLEYAPLAEVMGRVHWASEIFNCSAPDTGNMEVLARYGTFEQKERWLRPLLDGTIRSAFGMTEPQVASSDATNIELTITADGDDYVLNGRKWWTSGSLHPDFRMLIVMGKTDPTAERHRQQSMIIVPADTPGFSIVRRLTMFGFSNAPGGEAETRFDNARIPKANLLLGEGRGFEIAQGRLGPGRIHHCMRSIGQAQRSLEMMAKRVEERTAFGRKLADQGRIREDVARSFCEIEMARLLTLKAADAMDRHGNKDAKGLIAAIKIVAPGMAQAVTDRAIQAFGGKGVSGDTPIAYHFLFNRALRIFDGPDEVHLSQLGKLKIREYAALNRP